jgi:hypothetical protein
LCCRGGPLGRLIASDVANTVYTVIAQSGKEYDFGRISLMGFSEFGKILREVAHQKKLRWEKVEERG